MFELNYQCDIQDKAQALEQTAVTFVYWANYLSLLEPWYPQMDIITSVL